MPCKGGSGEQQRASDGCPQREALQEHVNLQIVTDVMLELTAVWSLHYRRKVFVSDQDAHVHKITALTIDDLRTSGAQTPTEIRAALRVSLYSLNGDEALPALIARLMPTGIVQRPKIIVQR